MAEKEQKIKRVIPSHRSTIMFDFAIDTCEDWKEIVYHTKENTEMYWFKTDQLKKLIKESMRMGYDSAVEHLTATKEKVNNPT